MALWYKFCEILPIEFLQWDFMKNALAAILIMAPLFGLLSTMIVTGRMSFFSDALGHSAFTVANPNAIAACKKYDNLYCDTTISNACDNVIEDVVDKIGEDRLLYGSDMAFFTCIHNLGKIAMSRLTDQAKEKILGLNAKKLFEL